jgi:hypothetical protein
VCILKGDEDINVFCACNKFSPFSGPYFYMNYLSIFISVFVRQISFKQRRSVTMINGLVLFRKNEGEKGQKTM